MSFDDWGQCLDLQDPRTRPVLWIDRQRLPPWLSELRVRLLCLSLRLNILILLRFFEIATVTDWPYCNAFQRFSMLFNAFQCSFVLNFCQSGFAWCSWEGNHCWTLQRNLAQMSWPSCYMRIHAATKHSCADCNSTQSTQSTLSTLDISSRL